MDKRVPKAKSGPFAGPSPNRVDFDPPGRSRESGPASVDGAILSMLTPKATEVRDGESSSVLELVRRGLPFAAFENLVEAVGAPQREVARAVGMAATTLGRRRKTGRLTPVESDHVMRIARLAALARELMAGDPAPRVPGCERHTHYSTKRRRCPWRPRRPADARWSGSSANSVTACSVSAGRLAPGGARVRWERRRHALR